MKVWKGKTFLGELRGSLEDKCQKFSKGIPRRDPRELGRAFHENCEEMLDF